MFFNQTKQLPKNPSGLLANVSENSSRKFAYTTDRKDIRDII